MYRATTRGIEVTVEPKYLADQSAPDKGRWVWAYTIEIKNRGAERVQLLSRHWQITDETGHTQEVTGPGVVGEQPVLAPGESFRYTSGVPLTAASGVMVGTYSMISDSGAQFEVAVPAFSLDVVDPVRAGSGGEGRARTLH